MRTYVADFIPRFRQFSEKLDNETLLVNQHWVMVDEITSTKTVYIFQRDNRLLLSRDGEVEIARWEMIDPQNVLVTVGDKSFMFKHGFLDENVLALKLDGKDEYAMFFNEDKSNSQLNALNAMNDFLEEKYLKPEPPVVQSKSTQSVYVRDIDSSNKTAALCCVAAIIIIVLLALTGGLH